MRAIRTASAALLTAAAVALSAPAAFAGDGASAGTGAGPDAGAEAVTGPGPGAGTGSGPGAGTGDPTGQGITSFGFSVTPRTVAPGGTVTLTSDGCEVPSVTVTSGIFDTVTLTEGRPGSATVDVEAKAGAEYEIAFDCKGERGTTSLTITHGTTPPPAPVTPHKGVKAGFGSSTGSDALGAAELAGGAVLITGALAAAVVLTRRGRTGDRP
ncbi:hypothetical protein ACIGHB_01060 [Streptomyces sp. NPDC085460]|uniref:hypothetical protein n=1 Tax=Streptomyces sp. NPDC085460 TaxID=3365723 RepID=UPI0037D70D1D